jgi:hypothetical protein
MIGPRDAILAHPQRLHEVAPIILENVIEPYLKPGQLVRRASTGATGLRMSLIAQDFEDSFRFWGKDR